MNERVRFVFAGFFVGVAELLPGISGSTVALAFGVYEKFVTALSQLRIKNLSFNFTKLNKIFYLDLLVPFILAMALSVLIASKLILFLYTEYTSSFEVFLAITMMLISILLLKDLNYSSPSILITYLTIGVSLGFLLEMIPDINPEPMLALIVIFGFIAFSFFLIPGISGSAILLSLGAYKLVISSIANLDLAILIPFASGCLLSLLIMPKLILFLMTNYKNNTISLFSGLIFISGALLLI